MSLSGDFSTSKETFYIGGSGCAGNLQNSYVLNYYTFRNVERSFSYIAKRHRIDRGENSYELHAVFEDSVKRCVQDS